MFRRNYIVVNAVTGHPVGDFFTHRRARHFCDGANPEPGGNLRVVERHDYEWRANALAERGNGDTVGIFR